MLFYKHKNSFILPPYVRVRSYARVRTHDVIWRENFARWGDTLSVRTRTHAWRHLAGKCCQMGGYSLRTHAYARMTSLPCGRTQRHPLWRLAREHSNTSFPAKNSDHFRRPVWGLRIAWFCRYMGGKILLSTHQVSLWRFLDKILF
jgi:hypothetical protein